MEGLTPRQRSLLRLHVLDGVTLAQLARSYQVHRATIVRWLAQARAEILERTRVAMAQRLRLPEGELEALHLTVSSQLDLSLKRLLASHLSER
jgi:RNA polymerase sigma-70 factor (ECF subfamily)